MKIKKEIEYDVCDDCGRPFGGEVHPFGGGEYCSNCWVEPTPDMRMHAEAIYRGLQQQPRDTLKEFMSGFAVVYQTGMTKAYIVAMVKDKATAEELALQCGASGSKLIDIFDRGVALYASVFVEVRYAAQTNTVSEEKLPLDLDVARSTYRCRLCGKHIHESGHCGIQLEFGQEFAHRDCWMKVAKPKHEAELEDAIKVERLLSDVVKSGARDTVKNVVRMLNECGYGIVKKEGA